MTRTYTTFVEMTFNSEGSGPMEVIGILEELGFNTSRGQHDFKYDWGSKEPELEEIKKLLKRLHGRLKGHRVLYQITTI